MIRFGEKYLITIWGDIFEKFGEKYLIKFGGKYSSSIIGFQSSTSVSREFFLFESGLLGRKVANIDIYMTFKEGENFKQKKSTSNLQSLIFLGFKLA